MLCVKEGLRTFVISNVCPVLSAVPDQTVTCHP
jgi:hypothetical protein